MKKKMNLPRRILCRCFQTVFRLAIPFMPYRTPKQLASCAEAADLLAEKGRTRALVVTDKGVRAHGLTLPVEEALKAKGIGCEIYDETPVNPTVSAVEKALALYREKGCDALVAVGGGSAMDCAKGVCARLIKPKKSLLRMQGILKVRGKQPFFLAVPTTAGTGSETTVAAVLTDDENHHKFTVLSFCLAPRYALLDPVFTKTLPPAPTAETGLDALTHAVEAYIGRSTTRKTRRLAVHAVSLVKDNLLPAYRNGEDLVARRNMQLAAFDAGLAFTISYVGYVHALAHALGGAYNYPHGRTNATLLPVVLRAYGKSCTKKLARLARKSGVSAETDDGKAAEEFISWIEGLNRATGIPEKLDVLEKDIPRLAAFADEEANPLYPVPELRNARALEELYRLARADRPATAEETLALQREYFRTGLTLDLNRRKYWLKKLKAAIVAHEEELLAALKADLGKGAMESYMCEIGLTRSEITYQLRRLKKFAREKRVRTPLAQFAARSFVKPSPYGNVLIMSPWNYPFLLTIEPLVDALAAGNTAVLKPSAYSPATGAAIEKLVKEVFPPEICRVVLGGRAENGALLGLKFDKIFFTGSVAVGKEVMRRASENLIPVTLELGGKSPCIVGKSANIPLAAKRIVFGKFLNCGQTCVAPDHIFVHESVKERLIFELKKQIERQFGADPLKNPDYGKIVNEKHFRRICGLIDRQKICCGGKTDEKTLRIEPTILRDATREDACMQEEIFGPVLPVLTYSDDDALLREFDELPSPLALYIFSEDREQIARFTARARFGGGCVNDVVIHLATSNMGFGGVGESGMGSYHGKDGFDCFSHRKSIVDKKTAIDLPMRYQPYRKIWEKLVRFFLK